MTSFLVHISIWWGLDSSPSSALGILTTSMWQMPPFLAQTFMEECGLSHEIVTRTRAEVAYIDITYSHIPLVRLKSHAPQPNCKWGRGEWKGILWILSFISATAHQMSLSVFSHTQNTPYSHFFPKEYNHKSHLVKVPCHWIMCRPFCHIFLTVLLAWWHRE